MPVDPRLKALTGVSNLIKDMALNNLRAAEAERALLHDRLRVLSQSPSLPEDLPPAALHEVTLRYQRWAELRRREIEVSLARQNALCDRARDAARQAFGRDAVLTELIAKPRR
jgi:hypothetical protein